MTSLKTMRGSTKKKIAILGGLCVAFAVIQILNAADMLNNQMKGVLVEICYNILLAVSLNLTVGVLGELSLGHAGFMCIGAFVGAFSSVFMEDMIAQWWIRFPLALLLGGVVAALFGFLVGLPILRLRGDYLAIVTLAFGEIIWNLCSVLFISKDVSGALHFQIGGTADPAATYLLGGPQGVSSLPRLPKQDETMFIIGFILVFITVWLCLNLIHSRTGRAVKAIRDNRIAAESIGINITKHKLIIFTISAFFAGIAGVMYSQKVGVALPSQAEYGYPISIQILTFVVLGGMGSTLGSIVSATVLTLIPELLRKMEFLKDLGIDPMQWRMLLYSIVLIAVMLCSNSEKVKTLTDTVKSKVRGIFRKNATVDKEAE